VSPEVLEHPEFELDLAARAGDAVLALLQGDDDLAAYFRSIQPVEVEDLAMLEVHPPELCVLIPDTDSVVVANADTGQLTIAVELLMFHEASASRGNRRWLRHRIAAHIKRLIYSSAAGGRLSDGTGDITEALTRFGRVPFLGRLVSGAVATPIRIEWTAWEDLAAGDFV